MGFNFYFIFTLFFMIPLINNKINFDPFIFELIHYPKLIVENEKGWGPNSSFFNFFFMINKHKFTKNTIIKINDDLLFRSTNYDTLINNNIIICNWYNLNGKIDNSEIGYNDDFEYVSKNYIKKINKSGKKNLLRYRLMRIMHKEQLKLRREANKVKTGKKVIWR